MRDACQAVECDIVAPGHAGQAALDGHAKLEELQAKKAEYNARDLIFSQLRRNGTIAAAGTVYRLAVERAKPDAEREQGYQQRDLPEIKAGLEKLSVSL